MFISTRPAEKVTNEISIVIGYPFKTNSEATAEVGTTNFALYTQADGAWIKNAGDEARMIDAMRTGQSLVVKGVSGHGTNHPIRSRSRASPRRLIAPVRSASERRLQGRAFRPGLIAAII